MSYEASQPRRIAVEEAFATNLQMDALRDAAALHPEDADDDLALAKRQTAGGTKTRDLLDLEGRRLDLMDESGIDVALLLLTSPGVQLFQPGPAMDIARHANDAIAEIVSRHPSRFAALAAVAPQAPREAAREIERGVRDLDLRGVVINSHTDGEYLSEDKYAPILEAAEAMNAPLYLHPRCPIPQMAKAFVQDQLSTAIWGFQAETGLHALRLITGGVFDRFPKLKVVLGHAGEALPYWMERIDYMHASARGRRALDHKPSHYIRNNFWITTSGMNWHDQIAFLIAKLGSERLMFAADYPYQVMGEETRLMDSAPISEADRRQIYSGTAETLFRL